MLQDRDRDAVNASLSVWHNHTFICLLGAFSWGRKDSAWFGPCLISSFSLSPRSPAVRSQGDRGGVWCCDAEESHAERPGGSCELPSLQRTSDVETTVNEDRIGERGREGGMMKRQIAKGNGSRMVNLRVIKNRTDGFLQASESLSIM